MDAEDLMLSAYQRGYRDGWVDGLAGREYHPDTESEGFAQWQADNAAALASQPVPASSDLVGKLRMIVSHATGGASSDIDQSVNDTCVEITRHVNRVWDAARASEREECAKVAEVYSSIHVEKRDDSLNAGNYEGALTRARQAQTCDEIATAIRERNGRD